MADELVRQLRAIVGPESVLSEPDELLVYECDGLPQHKYRPRAVVFPESTEATAEVMRTLARNKVSYTPRGAGTGLSGGALALNEGVLIELGRMRQILRVDSTSRIAVVQTGVVNINVSKAVAHLGLYYIPDPSSQPTCTIGGNIAESAGGIHCLKYGTTTDHVLSARVVLSDGSIVDLASAETGTPGYDLLGLFIGSEGTFGIATEATLRLAPIPPAVRTLLADFAEVDDASKAVSAIIAAGVMPAALEMMDHQIIRAIEASIFAAGLPADAGAALLIELDGIETGIEEEAEQVKTICLTHGARSCRLARDDNERKKLWAARKGAFGAIGRIAPDSMIQDTVVPRSKLPDVLRESYNIAAKYELILANVFHAGDGNLHPFICFDSRYPDQVLRVKEAGRELMEVCVRAGGSITGEHGVGLDKREYLPLIFSFEDMHTMLEVRAAFDPLGLCNPGKIIPVLKGCGEARAVTTVDGNGDTARLEQQLPQTDRDYAANKSAIAAQMNSASSPVIKETLHTSESVAAVFVKQNIQSFHPLSNGDCSGSSILTVTPRSVEEVSSLLRLATEESLKVVPRGAGAWADAGNPLAPHVVLSTLKLKSSIEHEPADLVASASAGVTLKDFNERLAQGGQWLPLDPPDDGCATIGGVVATGLAGPLSYAYGPPRRSVIGMKVCLANGKLIKAGGRVVKNVAGYDLCKLFTGSYGTLGVITDVTFKLRPLPQSTRTVLAHGPLEVVLNAARTMMTSHLFPAAVELVSGSLAGAMGLSNGSGELLLIRFAGTKGAVTEQTNSTRRILAQTDLNEESDDSSLWKRVVALPVETKDCTVWRAILPQSAFLEWMDVVKTSNTSSKPRLRWQASGGGNFIRVIEEGKEEDAILAERLQKLRTKASRLGGTLVIEHASQAIKKQIDSWGDFGARGVLMKRIKERLDPDNVLSPGRF